jgi:hypothetical protein
MPISKSTERTESAQAYCCSLSGDRSALLSLYASNSRNFPCVHRLSSQQSGHNAQCRMVPMFYVPDKDCRLSHSPSSGPKSDKTFHVATICVQAVKTGRKRVHRKPTHIMHSYASKMVQTQHRSLVRAASFSVTEWPGACPLPGLGRSQGNSPKRPGSKVIKIQTSCATSCLSGIKLDNYEVVACTLRALLKAYASLSHHEPAVKTRITPSPIDTSAG